jgi:salicylate hydroxylase
VHVAIAGAGIAGLTAAVALAKGGASVEVFERAQVLEEIGAGIQLSPNAMAVLERLGIAPELAGRVFEPAAIEIREAGRNRLLARIPLGEAARLRYGSPYAVIARADLHGALLAAARRLERIGIHLGAEIRDPQLRSAGVGFQAAEKARHADILIAADGVHSALRTGFFGHPGPRETGLYAWRATLPVSEAPEHLALDSTGLWLGRRAHLVHYPIAGGERLNVVVIAGAAPDPSPPAVRFGESLQPLFQAAQEWRVWPILSSDPARAWTKGSVALIGDSAHAMLPSAAQGGAQAIEDAWVLARSLFACPADPVRALACL